MLLCLQLSKCTTDEIISLVPEETLSKYKRIKSEADPCHVTISHVSDTNFKDVCTKMNPLIGKSFAVNITNIVHDDNAVSGAVSIDDRLAEILDSTDQNKLHVTIATNVKPSYCRHQIVNFRKGNNITNFPIEYMCYGSLKLVKS